jgi:hypothetical protein
LPFGPVFTALIASFLGYFRSRAALQLEILALRHQIGVLQRSVKRPKLTAADRLLWAWLATAWRDWKSGAFIMKASYGDRLASQGIPLVLDVENSPWQARAADNTEGNSRADSYHQPRKSYLGSSEDPW